MKRKAIDDTRMYESALVSAEHMGGEDPPYLLLLV